METRTPCPRRGRFRWRAGPVLIAAVTAWSSLALGCAGRQPDEAATTTSVALIAVDEVTPAAHKAAPLAGECRQDGSSAVKRSVSDGQAPVPCTDPHGLETWKVAPLPDRWRAVAHLPAGDAVLDDDLEEAIHTACPRRELATFLGTPPTATKLGRSYRPQPVQGFTFLPSPAQWAAGERWVRCDVGYRWGDPDGSLRATLAPSPPTAPGADPVPRPELDAGRCFDRDEEPVPCTEAHVAQFVVDVEEPTTPRPATATTAGDAWETLCRSQGRALLGGEPPDHSVWIKEWGSENDWSNGRGWVRCSLGYSVTEGQQNMRDFTGSLAKRGSTVPPEAS